MNLKEINVNVRDWMESTQDVDYSRAIVNVTLDLQVTWNWRLSSYINIATTDVMDCKSLLVYMENVLGQQLV